VFESMTKSEVARSESLEIARQFALLGPSAFSAACLLVAWTFNATPLQFIAQSMLIVWPVGMLVVAITVSAKLSSAGSTGGVVLVWIYSVLVAQVTVFVALLLMAGH
jgi:FtsH-binding integral membrane protein